MSDLTSAPQPASSAPSRCSACGQTITSPEQGRCPLCDHLLIADDVTSEDHTPYAQARDEGRRGWWAMCRWIYGAGKHRLAHLGLARPSRASKRFARINCLLLAVAVGLSILANTGWHTVTVTPGSNAADTPAGRGWLHVIDRDLQAKDRFVQVISTDLWWNALHALVCGAATFALTLLGSLIVVRIVKSGAAKAAHATSNGPRRFVGAVDYGTAWLIPVSVAVLVTALRPAAEWMRVAELGLLRSAVVFDVSAVLIGVAGVLLGWFWWIRLGQATHGETRGAIVSYFLVRAPLIVAVIAAALGAILWYGASELAVRLNLIW